MKTARVLLHAVQIEEDGCAPTLRDGLRGYATGSAIRAIRLKKTRGMVELERRSGRSPARLSRIERGQLFQTVNGQGDGSAGRLPVQAGDRLLPPTRTLVRP
jgi:hypothetical protein